MIAAVIFDVDGTLAETERDGHRVAFNLAFEAMGLPWRWDDYYNAFIEAVALGRGVSVSDVRSGMGEGRVLGADAALAAGMVDGIATFDEVLSRMQASVRSKQPRSQSRLKQARDALALI